MNQLELPAFDDDAPTVVASTMHVHRRSTPQRPPEVVARPEPRSTTEPHPRDRRLALGAGLALGLAVGLLLFVVGG